MIKDEIDMKIKLVGGREGGVIGYKVLKGEQVVDSQGAFDGPKSRGPTQIDISPKVHLLN